MVLVGVVVLLVAGAVGWGPIGTQSSGADSPTAAGDERADLQNESDGNENGNDGDENGSDGNQNESGGNESVITPNQTIEALEAVENQTNGTVFRARLSGEPGSDLDESEFVYELDVLAENGTHLVAEVYAANATVVGVESANDSDGIFADLFGSSDDVPDAVREADDLRSATDAVRLAVNETGAEESNRTITQVVLETHEESPVYRIQQFDPSGNPQEILVAATGDDGVVTTDPQSSRDLSANVLTSK